MSKTREEIILELIKSLNTGNCGYISDRVYYACKQYNDLVDRGIIIPGEKVNFDKTEE